MSEGETTIEKIERQFRQLDPRRQKMVSVYTYLLGHDREFQKMPEVDRRTLIDRWFEERPSA